MMDTYKIKFEGDLVGRRRRIEPFDVVAANQDQLRTAILKQIRPLLASKLIDLEFSFKPDEGLTGIVVVGGYRPVGQFKVIQTEGTKE